MITRKVARDIIEKWGTDKLYIYTGDKYENGKY